MATRALLIQVGLLDDRWHGVGDWPPSPFRLFQALVAGAYGGRWVGEEADAKDAAFRWLERQSPPSIAAPARSPAQPVAYFVPNNDLDSVGGDPSRIAEIRTAKVSAPALLEQGKSFLYAWPLEGDEPAASLICELAGRLHAFGRGVDAAFARAEVVDFAEGEAQLAAHGGAVSRPSAGHAAGLGRPARSKALSKV